jgi:acid phosphatase class B
MSKNIIVVDIDGTIARFGDRLKYLQEEILDWDLFCEHCDEDAPIEDMIRLVEDFYEWGYHIVFCTGRREGVREKTRDWIKNNIAIGWDYDLLMRKDRDWRHNTEVKPELLSKFMWANKFTPGDIYLILDNRDSMVARWRELGYRCLQVANGPF